uniref:Uncharacterized protein n=1 Tax=Anguilla anguilla TaxID=7936 RepID=A0A0E9RQM6_ANGAN
MVLRMDSLLTLWPKLAGDLIPWTHWMRRQSTNYGLYIWTPLYTHTIDGTECFVIERIKLYLEKRQYFLYLCRSREAWFEVNLMWREAWEKHNGQLHTTAEGVSSVAAQ